MKYTTVRSLLYITLLLFLITSCKSTKPVVPKEAANDTSAFQYLESVLNNAPNFNSFASKMRLSVNLDGKDLTVSGSLKMKKNDAIQLSITPLLGIEVAKIEITPEYILILDRMNKRYVQAPVSLLKTLGNSELDFYSLQALFFNELFLPGTRTVATKDFSSFIVRKTPENNTLLQVKQANNLNFRFVTTTSNARLTECSILARNNFQFNWKYAGFEPLSGKTFPSQMSITLLSEKNRANVVLDLSKMNSETNSSLRTEIPKKYKQMDLNELIKQLLNI